MTIIHILFAKMLVKMFSHVITTCFNLTRPSSGNIFFHGIYRSAYIVTRTLKYAVVYLFLVLYGVSCSYDFCIAATLCTIGVPSLCRVRAILVLSSLYCSVNNGILKEHE
jgi:hypothetical protein